MGLKRIIQLSLMLIFMIIIFFIGAHYTPNLEPKFHDVKDFIINNETPWKLSLFLIGGFIVLVLAVEFVFWVYEEVFFAFNKKEFVKKGVNKKDFKRRIDEDPF